MAIARKRWWNGEQPPHALTEEQRAIAEKAKRSPGTELVIESIVGDVEAKNLSDDIAAALRSVDWTVHQSTPYFIQKPDQLGARGTVRVPFPTGWDRSSAGLRLACLTGRRLV